MKNPWGIPELSLALRQSPIVPKEPRAPQVQKIIKAGSTHDFAGNAKHIAALEARLANKKD